MEKFQIHLFITRIGSEMGSIFFFGIEKVEYFVVFNAKLIKLSQAETIYLNSNNM